MKMEERDRELEEKIREALDESVASLDGNTLRRLQRIRLDALEVDRSAHRLFALPRWVTAGGFATSAVLVVAVSVWLSTARHTLQVKQAEDLEIITAQEHLELYEDLDFYRWLAEK